MADYPLKIINKENLTLEEITFEKYVEFLKSWMEARRRRFGWPKKAQDEEYAFARILRPLILDDYQDAINRFAETPSARRLSTKNGDHWERLYIDEMDGYSINEFIPLAKKAGFFYLQFNRSYEEPDNEIGFEEHESKIISVNLAIPGVYRDLYSWKGSDKPYRLIKGIWIPDML